MRTTRESLDRLPTMRATRLRQGFQQTMTMTTVRLTNLVVSKRQEMIAPETQQQERLVDQDLNEYFCNVLELSERDGRRPVGAVHEPLNGRTDAIVNDTTDQESHCSSDQNTPVPPKRILHTDVPHSGQRGSGNPLRM